MVTIVWRNKTDATCNHYRKRGKKSRKEAKINQTDHVKIRDHHQHPTSYRVQSGRPQQRLLVTPDKRLVVVRRLLARGGIPGCPHGSPPSGLLLKNRRAQELQICELVPAPQLPVNTREEPLSQQQRQSNVTRRTSLRIQRGFLVVHDHGAAPLARRDGGGATAVGGTRAGELAEGCRGQIGHVTQTQAPPSCPHTTHACRNVMGKQEENRCVDTPVRREDAACKRIAKRPCDRSKCPKT